MNFSTLCTILVTFSPETPEFMLLKIASFSAIQQKSDITSNISEYPRPVLTYFTGLVDVLVSMIIPMFVWQSPKGRCYGNQINLEDGCRHRQDRPLLLTSAFDNGLVDRKSAFNRLNGNIRATSCQNLVNFRPIIWEFTLLKRATFPRFARNLTTIFIRHVGVSKCIGRSQFSFQQNNRQSFLYTL